MMLFRMAWRNLWRNPRRTIITVASMVFGLTMMIVAYTLTDGMLAQMVRYATLLGSGHIQIHHPDYLKDHSIYDTMSDPAKLLAEIRRDNIGAASPRIYATALVSSGPQSAGARIWGIDPALERKVTELNRHLASGSWIPDKPEGYVVLGQNLAKTISAVPGSEIVVLTQAADGSLGNNLFKVSGVLKSIGEALDRGGVIMHIKDLSSLIALDGQIHEIAVRLNNPDLLVKDRNILRNDKVLRGLDIRDWKQLFPELDQYMRISDQSMSIVLFIIFAVASLGIINTQLMALFERTREVGIMRAIGMGPFPVAWLVFLETVYMAILSSILGGILGSLWSLRLEKSGWDISWMGGSFNFIGVAFDPHLYAKLTPTAVFQSITVMMIVIVLSTFYPLYRAARISPVDAIGRGR